MKIHPVLLCFLLALMTSCSGRLTTSGPTQGLPATEPHAVAITGKYCTTWNSAIAAGNNPAFAVVCLQPDGSWAKMTTDADIGQTCSPAPLIYTGLELTRAPNGDFLLLLTCIPQSNDARTLLVKRHSASTNTWTNVGNTAVNWNTSNNKLIHMYSQFGASLLSWGTNLGVFWTESLGLGSTPNFASFNGNLWTHTPMAWTGFVRHPETYTNGSRAFLHIGQPAPEVWEVTTGTPVSLGAISAPGQYTLYTSLTLWNGQLAFAYSSTTPESGPWAEGTNQTKVAFKQPDGSWLDSGSPIEDTPGRDGSNSHLFVINNELHILYADYTTLGLPTNSQRIIHRFRVKKWNGSTWVRVGGESDPVWLSQRYEFLQEGDQVLVSVFRNGNTHPFERIVLGWNPTDSFYPVGQPITGWADNINIDWPRPGAIVVGR